VSSLRFSGWLLKTCGFWGWVAVKRRRVSIIRRCTYAAKGKHKKQQTPWPLVRERTIPTERPPLVDEI
jgi:hypothetical protein